MLSAHACVLGCWDMPASFGIPMQLLPAADSDDDVVVVEEGFAEHWTIMNMARGYSMQLCQSVLIFRQLCGT